MGRLHTSIRIPGLDAEAMKKAVREAIEIRSREAARAFVRAAMPRVPVQTGMARGSFLNIGRALKVAIPIKPNPYRKRVRKNGSTYMQKIKWYYPPDKSGRMSKTPESGAKLSSDVPFFAWQNSGKYVFNFQSAVNHFNLNDHYHIASGPWHALEAGKDAYIAEMAKIRNTLPKISAFMLETNITHGPLGRFRVEKLRIRNRRKF